MANLEATTQLLERTPLYELVVAQKARLTAFSGWEMPVQYTTLTQEHEAVRTASGIFDISHMGKFIFEGKGLIEQLQRLVPSDLSRLQPGQAQYTVLLNADAGIIDDIIFYYQGEDDIGNQRGVLIVNAGTRLKDKNWILGHLDASNLNFQDLSGDKVLIAVQGPQALSHLQSFVDQDISKIKAFNHLEAMILNTPAFIARTGYTGEDGFEVMLNPSAGVELWRSLVAAGVKPCGLGARDTLRLEAAMALYGQDIDESTTPLEAGLGWIVHLDTKGDFIGRKILERQKVEGVNRKLVGLQMQGRNIARHGYPVIYNGEKVGEVTSGTLAPTVAQPIGLAYIPTNLARLGQQLEVEIRGKTYPCVLVKKPFYKRSR